MDQLIHEPTRVTPTSKTLIDVILTSMAPRHKNTSVIKVTLSDHFLVCTDVVSKISFKPKEIKCRKLKGFSKNEFLSDLTVFTNNIDYNVDLVTLWNTFKTNQFM